MHARTALAFLAAACLALTGCSNSDTNDETKPSTSPTQDPGDAFVASVIDAHLDSYAAGVPAADELKAFPPQWCTSLDSGHSVAWMFDLQQGNQYPIGQTWGTKKADAYEVLLLGVKTHCPKHRDAVLEELRATGEY
ncbi:hypothetical protein IMX12_13270 [Streptomyces sp. Babs14]|uniref:hypothetical protein n=1 Tax=unclassified Streptomyces TaxID=2593676 RepID=UPI001C21C251|nr:MULTISPECIES: hypothetical protein [unclassified Streptomyces]MBU8549779.1 hypothetical protein [Streptomyces sp. Osf17]MBU8556562.1 hypothetical protein [Streptomyces sp. Babs14]